MRKGILIIPALVSVAWTVGAFGLVSARGLKTVWLEDPDIGRVQLVFKLFAGGRRLGESGLMRGGDAPKRVDVGGTWEDVAEGRSGGGSEDQKSEGYWRVALDCG
jgi:hypothetical protein